MDLVDTGVLLYAISSDPADEAKARAAIDVLSGRPFALSVQVLQEFYWQATRHTRRHRLAAEDALGFLRPLLAHPIQDLTPSLFLSAAATAGRHRISYWDATIIEAARELGCSRVLTEDLTDGQDFGGVAIENPFRHI